MIDFVDQVVNEVKTGDQTLTAYWAYKELAQLLADRLDGRDVQEAVIEQALQETQEVTFNFVDVPQEIREEIGIEELEVSYEANEELMRLALDNLDGAADASAVADFFDFPVDPVDVSIHLK